MDNLEETQNRASKEQIIKDYMRELAYRSVEKQKSNTTKMSEMSKLGVKARREKKLKLLEEDVVAVFK